MSDNEMIIYHIPGCPFSERVEILAELKGIKLKDMEIDISKPRPDWLLKKTRGTTALPAMTLENGETLKESLVIMRYLEDRFPERPVAQKDPFKHAVEGMLIATDGQYSGSGYRMILNAIRQSVRSARRASMRNMRGSTTFSPITARTAPISSMISAGPRSPSRRCSSGCGSSTTMRITASRRI